VRAIVWRAGLATGALFVVLGALGLGSAGDGLRSTPARVAGVPVEIVRAGDGAARRPAVVVVHGYAGSGLLMRPFADTLARRGYVVALPDLAGHAANTRRYTDIAAAERDLAAVVRHVRGRPDVDPDRVALLGHSMGAAAVVRVGAADRQVAATVAISLGDDEAAALRPGPRRLLLMVGALEPAGLRTVADRALAGTDAGRTLRVPLVEHVGVLFADTTHREAAQWIDGAVNDDPPRTGLDPRRRVGAGTLTLLGALILVMAALIGAAPRAAAARPEQAAPGRPTWLVAGVVVAPIAGIVGGSVLARVLPAAVTGYLGGYFAAAGAVLVAAATMARRGSAPARPRKAPQWTLYAVGLAVAGSAAVLVPVHLGLTSMAPHGAARWSLIALLALATGVLLVGAQRVVRPPWSIVVLAAVGLPLPFAAAAGLAPGFVVLVGPLIAVLFAVYAGLAGVAWWARLPAWCAVPAGAVVVAWPVAATLPLT
jgi:alpha-beta hydrolase superfamily lysophospholipase